MEKQAIGEFDSRFEWKALWAAYEQAARLLCRVDNPEPGFYIYFNAALDLDLNKVYLRVGLETT
ncbi:MAG: hypothetical protein ACRECU_00815 [Methylocella sp.]